MADSTAFTIEFLRDRNGLADYWCSGPIDKVTLTPNDAHEQFIFDTGATIGSCDNQTPASYYQYTAVLPMPLSLTAATRYWLMVVADVPNDMPINWGWRVGTADNNISTFCGRVAATCSSYTSDLAFALSDR